MHKTLLKFVILIFYFIFLIVNFKAFHCFSKSNTIIPIVVISRTLKIIFSFFWLNIEFFSGSIIIIAFTIFIALIWIFFFEIILLFLIWRTSFWVKYNYPRCSSIKLRWRRKHFRKQWSWLFHNFCSTFWRSDWV